MIERIALILLAWTLVSIPAGIFVGKFIKAGKGPDLD